MQNENSDISDSSSEDNDSDEVDDSKQTHRRDKRAIPWCAVDTEPPPGPSQPHRSSITRAVWPPPQPGGGAWLNLRPVRLGNPFYGSKMQLHCKTGHYLAVYPDGSVRGTADDSDLHTFLELSSGGQGGHVRIKGLLTRLFVAMDKKGRLYGEVDPSEEATIFIESFQGYYKTYLSKLYAFLGWYIGIKKSGKYKRGHKTRYGQKAIKFLSVRRRFE